ncbi:tetratricopeptide repeat protein [Nostoc sp. FACHB-152]|uniref:tetratricopeptide repeat protein n=1 Tax=unclassified Nostoc TaxID=2593658 RepID=UPI001689BC0E|nr:MULTISPECIES: tetratricopeptide repeat protein [unclassified Nostoc]MBD2446346.1 tetratricopeptide repeat protein [Nostoc sp. FACHB-152]MBD2471825.1 tetratricopeptide repeat protein [Nostoc sp. FACHB-145]
MKPRFLSTTALITITWFTPVGEIQPAPASQSYRDSFNQVVEMSSSSSSNDVEQQLSGLLLIAGAGVIGWLAMKNSKKVVVQQQFHQNNLKQSIPKERSPSTAQSIKAQSNSQTETTDISTYIKRAYSHFRQGDTQQAIEEFNKAIGFNPQSAYLYGERANFRCKKLGDKEGAIEDYSKAICIHPQNALFYLWRSQAYNELGEQKKAIEDYNTAVRLAPENTVYHYFHGAVNSRE